MTKEASNKFLTTKATYPGMTVASCALKTDAERIFIVANWEEAEFSYNNLETNMTFLDSPIARCEAMKTMVLTDETQAQCAREHDCPPGTVCPLCGWFIEDQAAPHKDVAPAK